MTTPPEQQVPARAIGVIIVAAGSGSRLGLDTPKALVPVAGTSILERALRRVFGMRTPAQVVVVAPADQLAEARVLCESVAGVAGDHLTVVAGGSTRQRSVAAGLAMLDESVRTVLVHDAARAFTPSIQFELVASAVEETGTGIIPGLAVSDTIKQADAASSVVRTLDRSELVAVQTPQGFPRIEFVAAYGAATEDYTDDAALFAAAGHPVSIIAGDVLAFKITTPWDLRRAEGLARESGGSAAAVRTGVGIDVHAFDADSPLWLGALYWPGEPGLSGHSDGDVLSHAICDSLLSAAGLGDIGSRFGTDDDRYAGAHGDVFIRETVAILAGAGFEIGNVAVQVVARHPKLAARRDELEAHLGDLVGAPVSVSATTTDGLGFTGRGDGIAVIATALVQRSR
ncbi:MAG: 2-C-methyl-D-erythritol 4-phosphate cytidylyltransferase [Microbacteriaceae bacterium]|nr:2-C-methyl-D-erythritol 4-phosphate cytidylyltransferase [Microbacteriaceae bacterium]